MTSTQKILIIGNHQLQALAQSLALVQRLDGLAEISLVTDSQKMAFWQAQSSIAKVFNFETTDFWEARKQLKATTYDLCINLDPSFTARSYALFSGAKTKMGYAQWLFKGKNIDTEALLQQVTQLLNLTQKDFDLKPFLLQEKYEFYKNLKQSQLHQDPSTLWMMVKLLGSKPAKTYPLRKMAKLLDMAHSQNPSLFFFANYQANQAQYAKDLIELCQESTQKRILHEHYTGQLPDFLTQLYLSDALMGNPSGVPHLAALLGKKSFFIRPAQQTSALDKPLFTEVHIDDYLKDINHDHEQQLRKESFAMARQQRFEPEIFEAKFKAFLAEI